MKQVFRPFAFVIVFASILLTQNLYVSTSQCRVDGLTVTPIENGVFDVSVKLSVPSKPSISHRSILMRPKIDQSSVDAYIAYAKEGDMWGCYKHAFERGRACLLGAIQGTHQHVVYVADYNLGRRHHVLFDVIGDLGGEGERKERRKGNKMNDNTMILFIIFFLVFYHREKIDWKIVFYAIPTIPVAKYIFDQSTGSTEDKVDLYILLLKCSWFIIAVISLASVGYIASFNKLPIFVVLCSVFILVYTSQFTILCFAFERGECVLDEIYVSHRVEGSDVHITLSTEDVSSTYTIKTNISKAEANRLMADYTQGNKYVCKYYKSTPEPFVSLITSEFPNDRIVHLKHPKNKAEFEELISKLDFLGLGMTFGMLYTLFAHN